MYKLISSTEEFFLVSKSDCAISKYITEKVEIDPTIHEFICPDIKTKTLKAIVDYMKHHKGIDLPVIKAPLKEKDITKVTEEWDAKFILAQTKRLQNLIDIVNGAHYLQIKGLVHLGCAMIACLIKGKPLEQIQEFLTKRQKIEEDDDDEETETETATEQSPTELVFSTREITLTSTSVGQKE